MSGEMIEYDDWVEQLTPHVRSKFEGMHNRITDLVRIGLTLPAGAFVLGHDLLSEWLGGEA